MILIIGIIGSLITVYALGYMKDFQHHEPKDAKDRRPWFFFVMFLFLGAMVGLVSSNNLIPERHKTKERSPLPYPGYAINQSS